MPMIDAYAAAGTFSDACRLAKDLAATLMGHAHLNDELVTAARAEIAKLQARRNS